MTLRRDFIRSLNDLGVSPRIVTTEGGADPQTTHEPAGGLMPPAFPRGGSGVALAVMRGHWVNALAEAQRRREREIFREAAAIQDDLIAKYREWIAEADRRLSQSYFLKAAE